MKETQRPKVTANRIHEAWDTRITPMLEYMAENDIELADLEEYAHAKHAPEANAALRQANAKRFIDAVVDAVPRKKTKELRDRLKDLLWPKEYYDIIDEVFEEFSGNKDVRELQKRWRSFAARPSGMSDQEARAVLRKNKSNKPIEQARVMLSGINNARINILYRAGILAPEEYENIKNKYKYYVPLYREGFEDSKMGSGRGLQPAGRAVKTRGGSTRNVVNIVANSVSNLENAINRFGKAESAKTLFNLVRSNPNPELWTIKKVKKSPQYDEAGNLRMYPDPMSAAPNEMRFMVDGKQYILEVNRKNRSAMLMLKTLKAEDTMGGPFVNALSKLNRYLARINTSWSPEFILSNFARDIQTAGVNINDTGIESKKMLKGAVQSIRAIYTVERGKGTGTELENLYGRFKRAGGKISWSDVHSSVENLSKKLTRELDSLAGKRPVRKTVKEFMDYVDDANTAVENGVRLHVFKMATEQGFSDSKAAQIASDITVDFTKKGAAGPAINSLYLFANAGIQGSYRLFRAGAKSSKVRKIMGGTVASGILNGRINAIVGGTDDDGEDYFNKIDDYVRERNMIFMIPGTKGKYGKVPLPWGYNFFWNIGSEISRVFTKENYSALAGAGRLAGVFLDAFSPIQSGTILQTISPTVTDPFAQVAENKNWFGGELMPEKNIFERVPKPDAQRYWSTVSDPSRWVAEELNSLTGGSKVRKGFIDVSPETLDLFIDTAGGSMFRFAQDTLSLPYKVAKKDEINVFKVPFLRRVAGQKSEWADQRTYYENVTQILTAEKELDAYEGTDYNSRLKKKLAPERELIDDAKAAERRLRALRRKRNKNEARGKAKAAELINKQIEKVYDDFNRKYYEQIKGDKDAGMEQKKRNNR